MEEILDSPQLTLPTDERRFEAGRLERPASPRDDAQRSPERHEPDLPLQLVRAGIAVDDRLVCSSLRRLADEHRSGLGQRLDPRGGVDEVARNHALPFRPERHRSLAREHSRASTEVGRAHLVSERADGGDQVESSPDRAF
jgi:hypothetical protein